MKVLIIIASTRPGRLGDQIGKWIAEYTEKTTDFDVSVADLAEINLPFIDEPLPPVMNQYTKEHTKAWSKRVEEADAFIIVTPEYNLDIPPALVNAVDFLSKEWKRKPIGFVGYGITGAVRAIQHEKMLFTTLNTMPIPYLVTLVGVFKPAIQVFEALEQHHTDADRMLTELHIWAEALQTMRKQYPL